MDSFGGTLIYEIRQIVAVLIWAFGLPFLPKYASQSRLGKGPKPIERPSLNVSIYKEGKLDFYLLQEYDPADCDATEHHWRFHNSLILFEQVSERGSLKIDLNCPIPKHLSETLTGHISFEGPLRKVHLVSLTQHINGHPSWLQQKVPLI